ncbi:MAG: MFS transporter [Candidatus Limnocylindrales bacterium]
MRFGGVSRSQLAVAAPLAIFNLGFDFAAPFLPLLVLELGVHDLGEAALWSGLFLGITPLISAATSPFWGSMADRYGAKLMLLRVLLMFGLFLALTGFVQDLGQLLVLRVATGLMGGISPIAIALAVRAGPPDQPGRAVGMIQSAQYLPLVFGPAVGGLLLDSWGIRANFILAGVLSVLAAVVLVVWLPPDRDRQPVAADGRSRRASPDDGAGVTAATPGPRLHRRWLLLPVFVLFSAQLVDKAFNPIVPLMVGVLGAPPDRVGSIAGLIIGAGAAAVVVSSTIVGRLVERRSPDVLIAGGLLLGGLLCLPILLVQDPWQLLVLRVGVAFVAGSVPTVAYTMAARRVPSAMLGRTMGFMASAALLANATGPWTAGLVASWQIRFVFPVLGTLLLIAGVVFLAVRGTGVRRSHVGSDAGDPAG